MVRLSLGKNQMNDWIQKIEPEILNAVDIPDITAPPHFPVKDFAKALAANLALDELVIQIGTSAWKTEDNYFTGLGGNPVFFAFQMAPLEGELFWVMAYDDLKSLTSWKVPLALDHPDLVKGIHRFMFLEALRTIKQMKIYEDLSPKFVDNEKFDKKSFAIDVSIKRKEELLWGRLLISPTFYKSFAEHYALKKPKLVDLVKCKGAMIPLTIRAGSVTLSKEELESLEEGDFIVVEDMYYRPGTGRGSFRLMLEETPLFQVKWKEDTLKILDYIYSYVENSHGRK